MADENEETISTDAEEDEENLSPVSDSHVDEQWASLESFSEENRTFISFAQASVLSQEEKSSRQLSSKRILHIFLVTTGIMVTLFVLCCLLVRKPHYIQRLRMHIRLAVIFCCEASKVLFTSPSTPSHSSSSVPTETLTHHRSSYSVPVIDYQSSEYYMNDPMPNGHLTPSIYDAASEGRDSYSSLPDDRFSAVRRYDPYQQGESC